MTIHSGLGKRLRKAAADYLFAPGRLPRDRADSPSTNTSAARVYGQVIGLLIIICFRPLVLEVLGVAEMYGVRWEPQDQRWVWPCQFAVGMAVFFWLSWLVIARTPLSRVSPRRRLLQRGAAVVCGAVSMYAAIPTPHALQRQVALTVFSCTVAWLALEVCRAHGVSPLTKIPATAAERLRDWRIAKAALIACMTGGMLCILLVALLRWIDIDGVPVMKGAQLSTIGLDTFPALVLAVASSVAVEDVVIVAATTALLTAIRRPAWEIYTLVSVIEILLHAYFGLPALALALYAIGRVWLYRRYRRLLPLMAAHAALDLTAPIQWLPFIYRPLLLLPVAVVAIWIDHRLKNAAQPSGRSRLPPRGRCPTPVFRTRGTGQDPGRLNAPVHGLHTSSPSGVLTPRSATGLTTNTLRSPGPDGGPGSEEARQRPIRTWIYASPPETPRTTTVQTTGHRLTTRQTQILAFIKEATKRRGYAPSIREIGDGVGLRSSSSVQRHLRLLEEAGLLKFDPHRPRTFQIVTGSAPDLVSAPQDFACSLLTAGNGTEETTGRVFVLQVMVGHDLGHALLNGALLTVGQTEHSDAQPRTDDATISGRVVAVTHPM